MLDMTIQLETTENVQIAGAMARKEKGKIGNGPEAEVYQATIVTPRPLVHTDDCSAGNVVRHLHRYGPNNGSTLSCHTALIKQTGMVFGSDNDVSLPPTLPGNLTAAVLCINGLMPPSITHPPWLSAEQKKSAAGDGLLGRQGDPSVAGGIQSQH